MLETSPSYIKQLLQPNGNKRQGRRVWSIDLETVWLPLFHATNVMGDTALPSEALGCPIRLAYDKDGGVKFSKSGRPVTKVVKEVTQTVTLIRENMVANLQDFTNQVIEGKPNEYKHSCEIAFRAGKPLHTQDKVQLDKAIKLQLAQALREAERTEAESQASQASQPAKPRERTKEAVTA